MVWKIKWGIWQIFTKVLKSLKIGTWTRFFCPKLKMYEPKIYRGVMCHDNEKWYKSLRGIELSVQDWHEKFDEFWPEHLKISKICFLLGCLWLKYIIFHLKKSSKIISYGTGHCCKLWRISDFCFQKLHEDFDGILLPEVENVLA